jgi:hypothetical protein
MFIDSNKNLYRRVLSMIAASTIILGELTIMLEAEWFAETREA